MAKSKFRGKDRRLIKKTLKVLQAIQARDQIALNKKVTSAISTRMLILDYGQNPDPLYTAALALENQMTTLLGLS